MIIIIYGLIISCYFFLDKITGKFIQGEIMVFPKTSIFFLFFIEINFYKFFKRLF